VLQNRYEHLALLTDFYQLTMAYAYWKKSLAERRAVFHLFFRRPPFKGGFTIACGLEQVVHFVEHFHFDSSDLAYLDSLTHSNGERYFGRAFLDMLSNLKLTVDVDAVPEGSVVFPYEPLVRVEGPLMQCQLLESPLLNLINFPTLIATKAARVVTAAAGDPVMEFGMRRAQGIDGALTASRAAFVGGCSSTSNVLAGKLYGIPVQGTQAHSWVMAFEQEQEAFAAYADVMPDSIVFLVDTYHTIDGVKKAIVVAKELQSQGKKVTGIRLDSGDLAELSRESRKLLDAAGLSDVRIVASNELDETLISELKRQGAKISAWGVGTNLVTGKDQGALDGVYKLSAIQGEQGRWRYILKLSEQLAKISNPGLHQVRRFIRDGVPIGDVIYDREIGVGTKVLAVDQFDPTKQVSFDGGCTYQDLLQPIFRKGACVYTLPGLQEIREVAKTQLQAFPVGIKRFLNPHSYPVMMEERLYHIKLDLIKQYRHQHTTAPAGQ